MSKNAKARRDAKKKEKRIAGANHPTSNLRRPVIVAQLVLDGLPYAAVGFSGREWNLVVQNSAAAGSDDPGTMWSILQALAAKAEANGNFVSVQSEKELKTLLDEHKVELDENDLGDLVDKILSVYPLPAPSIEGDAGFSPLAGLDNH